MTWLDKVQITAEVSTAGDLIAPTTTTPNDFTQGSGGIATGWTIYLNGGAVATDVNWTNNVNGQCISNALATATQYRYYGIQRNFPVKLGHRYIVGVDIRTMENKAPAWAQVTIVPLDGTGTPIFSSTNGITSVHSRGDWERTQNYTEKLTANAGYANVKSVQVIIRASYDLTDQLNWGVQFGNFFFTDVDESAAVAPTWRDIHCDIKSLDIKYGRANSLSRYDVATCNMLVVNTDGDFSYKDPHPFGLRPGRYVRLKAIYKGVTYPLYYGIIDSLRDGYSLDGKAATMISLVDLTTLGSNIPVPTIAGDGTGIGGAYSGFRIRQLVSLIGLTNYNAIQSGQWPMQPIKASGRTARDEMGLTADSENSLIYADRAGLIVYEDRATKTYPDTWNKVQADLFAGPHGAASSLPNWDSIPNQSPRVVIDPFELETDWTASKMTNRVTLAAAGESAKQYDDTESQKAYGIRTYQRLDLVCITDMGNSPTVALPTLASEIMAGQSEPVLRFDQVSYRPEGPKHVTDVWPFTLKVFPMWLVRVWYQNALTGWVYNSVVYVQAVAHRITVDSWETTLVVDQPLSFVSSQMSNVGWDYGKWDSNRWDEVVYG